MIGLIDEYQSLRSYIYIVRLRIKDPVKGVGAEGSWP
jgi:hypothetical protein